LSDCKDGVPTVLSGHLQVDASQPPVKDIGTPKTFANVRSDTDVYNKPQHEGGEVVIVDGQPLFLVANVDQVTLVGECTKKTWCTVRNPKIPLANNTGAVWGGDLEVPEG
jgi:hypothetical protein